MATVRVFTNPGGGVRVMHLNERRRLLGETDAQFFARETEKQPALAALPFTDVDANSIPTDRSKRHAWRLQGERVIVDGRIPVPAHPKQASLDAIDAALTLDQLKVAMKNVVRAGM